MRSALTIGLFVLLLSGLVGCTATAKTTQSERPAVLDNLVGSWRMLGHVQDQKVEYSLDVEWVLGDKFLLLRMQDVADPPEYEASVYIGTDATGKGLVAHWLDVFGGEPSKVLGFGSASEDCIDLLFDYPKTPFRDTIQLDQSKKQWRLLIEFRQQDRAWQTFADYSIVPK